MTCERYQEQISELIDRELTERNQAPVYKHLSECSECRGFLRSCLQMKESVQSLPDTETVPPRIEERAGWVKSFVRIPLPAAAVFVILFLAGVVGTSLHFFQGGETAATEQYQIIYISEYPEIEVRLMSGGE